MQLLKAVNFDTSYMAVFMENDLTRPQTVIAAATDFETIFKTHFKGLHAYACTIIKDEMAAEDIVQNTFFKLWEKNELHKLQSPAAYLYRAVYNESLNYLKHAKVKQAYQTFVSKSMEHNESAAGRASLRELQEKLDTALNDLPQQCRTIFQMSRFEELKYREIADRLGLSVKTVENQMGKALKLLRLKLVDFLPVLLILLNL
jgi:RNA polymerase sigma-70 factor, ECF subfamily